MVDDGQTGILVERGNARSFASAIMDLLGDPDRRKRLGQAGRRRVEEEFSWDRITGQLLDEYRRICPEVSRDDRIVAVAATMK
jgi:glycosyltransferase involved in cell wall biosynthesis